MNPSAPFIRRPVATLLLTIGLAMTGIAAFFMLPVSPLPQIDLPTITVTSTLSGASPSTMASSVAGPLERRLGTIAGVNQMTSQSGVGTTRVTLQFDLSRDINGAARDVQAAINAARADLPPTLRANPTYRMVNPADAPIIILALTSDRRTPAEIFDAVSTIVQQRLLQVEGVGDVELGGAALPAVRVDLNPLALARDGIALEDVRSALSAASANRPRGLVESNSLAWQIYSDAPGQHAAEYQNLPVAWRNGAEIRLSDVAQVYDGPEDVRTIGLFNGQRAVGVILTRQPGANIVATVDAVKAQLPTLAAALPSDIRLQVASDRTTTIRGSLHEVEITLAIANMLVVLVVSIFLRSLSATIVPATAVIVSLLGTLALMYLAGFSLNNLSLMALTVATGFVVDDAVVVLENIARHVEEGMAPFQAALRGAREVGFTVVSMSISLVAVFIPLLFMGGLVGRLFREFAVTMSAAVMISLAVSLATTPMLAALLLRRDVRRNRLSDFAERQFDRVHRAYARSLDWALANRGAVLLMLGATIALNVLLLVAVPKGFFPEQDTGALVGGMRTDQSISFHALQGKLEQIVHIVESDPGVATVFAFTGGTRAGSGFLFATLKPQGQRVSSRAIIDRLRPRLAQAAGVGVSLNPVQDMQVGARSTTSTYQYTLKGEDAATLQSAGARLVAQLRREPAVSDVNIDRQDGGAQVYVSIDQDTAARLGVTTQAIDAALYDAFGQRQVATIYSGLNQYHVVMGIAPQFNGSPESLSQVYVPTGQAGAATVSVGSAPVSASGSARDASSGSAVNIAPLATVPLSAIAHWQTGSAPALVNHQDGELAETISYNLSDGYSLGDASRAIAHAQAAAGLPAGVHGGAAGTAQAFQQSTSNMKFLILAALAAVYIVLGILYESAIHPLTVLSTLPSAGIGAVIALILVGAQLDIIGIIGIILLIGIVKKNAILIIDFALNAERTRGLSPLEAIHEASLRRFRPILMTTFAAALGALPLAIGFGEGAELRRPLGIAIIGGLIASQLLTMLTTPVVFLALDRFRHRPQERPRGTQSGGAPSMESV